MPPPTGPLGNVCVWLISIALFLSILAGGALLILYTTLPESEGTVWFPTAGMILVGIPWLFWIMTFFYRSITLRGEAAGRSPIRVVPAAAPASGGATAKAADQVDDSPVDSPDGKKKVHFGVATVENQQEADGGGNGRMVDREADRGLHAASNDSHDDGSSLGYRESEIPLALSMSR